MDANISLSSIEFEKVSNYVWVGSVKVNYSDGSSQYFKNEEYQYMNHDTYTFDNINQPIRGISTYKEQTAYSPYITFLGSDLNEIYDYNPDNYPEQYLGPYIQEILENEQIIGVYGNMNNDRVGGGLKRFGLILKVN